MPAVPLSQIAVHLRPEDNIAVAARNLPAGTEVQVNGHVLTDIRGKVFGHLQDLPIGYHARSQSGTILSRFSGDMAIRRSTGFPGAPRRGPGFGVPPGVSSSLGDPARTAVTRLPSYT